LKNELLKSVKVKEKKFRTRNSHRGGIDRKKKRKKALIREDWEKESIELKEVRNEKG